MWKRATTTTIDGRDAENKPDDDEPTKPDSKHPDLNPRHFQRHQWTDRECQPQSSQDIQKVRNQTTRQLQTGNDHHSDSTQELTGNHEWRGNEEENGQEEGGIGGPT